MMGLLYFNFSFDTPDGTIYPLGYARARQHADTSKSDNHTFVYIWRKMLAKKMCQKCSDRVGFPVARSISGCTKATCKWGNRSRNRNSRRPLPLSLPDPDQQNGEDDDDDDDDDDYEDDEDTERESPQTKKTKRVTA